MSKKAEIVEEEIIKCYLVSIPFDARSDVMMKTKICFTTYDGKVLSASIYTGNDKTPVAKLGRHELLALKLIFDSHPNMLEGGVLIES